MGEISAAKGPSLLKPRKGTASLRACLAASAPHPLTVHMTCPFAIPGHHERPASTHPHHVLSDPVGARQPHQQGHSHPAGRVSGPGLLSPGLRLSPQDVPPSHRQALCPPHHPISPTFILFFSLLLSHTPHLSNVSSFLQSLAPRTVTAHVDPRGFVRGVCILPIVTSQWEPCSHHRKWEAVH